MQADFIPLKSNIVCTNPYRGLTVLDVSLKLNSLQELLQSMFIIIIPTSACIAICNTMKLKTFIQIKISNKFIIYHALLFNFIQQRGSELRT